MRRPFRKQIDEGILDQAAALFAQLGYEKTSVQEIADAVGLSKAGLLHHFPTKNALHDAVLAQAGLMERDVVGQLQDLPAGTDRDRRAVQVLVDVALAHPGLVSLMLATAHQQDDPRSNGLQAAGSLSSVVFGDDQATVTTQRLVRILGTVSALAILVIAAHDDDGASTWRQHIEATCLGALGHPTDPDHSR